MINIQCTRILSKRRHAPFSPLLYTGYRSALYWTIQLLHLKYEYKKAYWRIGELKKNEFNGVPRTVSLSVIFNAHLEDSGASFKVMA